MNTSFRRQFWVAVTGVAIVMGSVWLDLKVEIKATEPIRHAILTGSADR